MSQSRTAPEHFMAWAGAAELLGAYPIAVDGPDPKDVADLFTETGVLVVHGGAEFHGSAAILEFLVGSRASRKGGSFRLRHHVSSTGIRIIDADRAIARCYFLAITAEQGPDHWGTYDDELERVGGHWYFARRQVTIEGASPDGWIGSGQATVKL